MSIMKININNIKMVILLVLVFKSYPSMADDTLKSIDVSIGEWKPYVSQDFEGYGELTQKITLILERMGYRPNYLFMPWGQAKELVANNAEDTGPRGTFPFRETKNRMLQFYFSEKPIIDKCIVFFYNKDKIKKHANDAHVLKSLNDLQKYNLAYIKSDAGYEYPEELQSVLNKKKVTVVENTYHLFKKLIESNEDTEIVPEVKEVGLDLLLDYFPKEMEKIAIFQEATTKECFLREKFYFITSRLNPNNAEFIDKFDEQHRELLESGELERITNKSKQHPSLRKPAVTLIADPSADYIKGLSGEDEYFLPRGTKGLLLEWKQNDTNNTVEARIYILTYPYRGKEVTVEGRHIELQ